MNLVKQIENFLNRFVSFRDGAVTLPIALWTIATHCFESFDAFPYAVITAATKRAGKTRLSEVLSFMAARPKSFGAMTAFTLFQTIDTDKPTIIFDEAEVLSSESANNMRAVLNMGYRKGQSVPRQCAKWWNPELNDGVGDWSSIKEFQTYCPKIFILIGDVYDTLRDRSIVITMQRGEPKERFVFETAKHEGGIIRDAIRTDVRQRISEIEGTFKNHKGIEFLTDRDEEIWLPLFVLCELFAPERVEELSRIAVDMCTEKTWDARDYRMLQEANQEGRAKDDEYATRLLKDVSTVLAIHDKISSVELVERLHALPTAPWRKFMGGTADNGRNHNKSVGLTVHNLADMLKRFGLSPRVLRTTGTRKTSKTYRGYAWTDAERALEHLDGK